MEAQGFLEDRLVAVVGDLVVGPWSYFVGLSIGGSKLFLLHNAGVSILPSCCGLRSLFEFLENLASGVCVIKSVVGHGAAKDP